MIYLEERPAEQEGPFLAEERNLIDSLAEMLRAAIERRQAQEQVILLQTIAMEVGAANDLPSRSGSCGAARVRENRLGD